MAIRKTAKKTTKKQVTKKAAVRTKQSSGSAVKKKRSSAAPRKTKPTKRTVAKKASTAKSAKKKTPATRKSVKPGRRVTPKAAGRRVADFASDVESLSSVEIEQELKKYEEEKVPVAAPALPSSEAEKLARRISAAMFEKKAEDVVVADLEGLTSVTDYFVICTATSDMHAKAIADHVEDQLHLEGARVHHKEGYQSLKWVLLDYVDVIAHVFQRDARVFYDLENLWGDARFESLEDVG